MKVLVPLLLTVCLASLIECRDVEQLIKQMSNEDKCGQMTQIGKKNC